MHVLVQNCKPVFLTQMTLTVFLHSYTYHHHHLALQPYVMVMMMNHYYKITDYPAIFCGTKLTHLYINERNSTSPNLRTVHL